MAPQRPPTRLSRRASSAPGPTAAIARPANLCLPPVGGFAHRSASPEGYLPPRPRRTLSPAMTTELAILRAVDTGTRAVVGRRPGAGQSLPGVTLASRRDVSPGRFEDEGPVIRLILWDMPETPAWRTASCPRITPLRAFKPPLTTVHRLF